MSEAGQMTPHTFLPPRSWKRTQGFANGILADG